MPKSNASSKHEEKPDEGKVLTRLEARVSLENAERSYIHKGNFETYAYPAYMFLTMNLQKHELTDISTAVEFQHVVCLDLCRNKLNLEAMKVVSRMPHLRAILIDYNKLESAAIPSLPHLQLLTCRGNQLTTNEIKCQPNLKYLDLNYNLVQELDENLWYGHLPCLQVLELRGNFLQVISGIPFPHLTALYLGENQIKTLPCLKDFPNLEILHLRTNPISFLGGFSSENKRLWYINLRDCHIRNRRQIRKLQILPALDTLIITGTPVGELKDSRMETLVILPNLKRFGKEFVSELERETAAKIRMKRTDPEDEEVDPEEDEDPCLTDTTLVTADIRRMRTI